MIMVNHGLSQLISQIKFQKKIGKMILNLLHQGEEFKQKKVHFFIV